MQYVVSESAVGLVVKYLVAIEMPRVRFPDGAYLFSNFHTRNNISTIHITHTLYIWTIYFTFYTIYMPYTNYTQLFFFSSSLLLFFSSFHLLIFSYWPLFKSSHITTHSTIINSRYSSILSYQTYSLSTINYQLSHAPCIKDQRSKIN